MEFEIIVTRRTEYEVPEGLDKVRKAEYRAEIEGDAVNLFARPASGSLKIRVPIAALDMFPLGKKFKVKLEPIA